MKDPIGDRMKSYYEDRTRYKLARRTYTIIRIDGKSFSNYTKGLQRPFDIGLMNDMNDTTAYLCKNIQGAKFGYVQSDEISLVLTDFDELGTHAWFDNNLQKMASVAASMATAEFNRLRLIRHLKNVEMNIEPQDLYTFRMAEFDARVFQIPFIEEVENYFIWRQQDATRNSISSVAQSLFSPRELNGKKTNEMQEMVFQKGINWNDYNFREKRGAVIAKVEVPVIVRTKEYVNDGKTYPIDPNQIVTRNRWKVIDTPIFSQDKGFIKSHLPGKVVNNIENNEQENA